MLESEPSEEGLGLGWGVAALTTPTQPTTVPVVANTRHATACPGGKLLSSARRSRDTTRELMMSAGAEVLLRDGISVGASTFRYADAFELLAERGVKVTRGSVHERIWSSQEAWQLDVISETIRRKMLQRRRIVAEAIAEHIAELPISTKLDRELILAESCRVGALAFIDDAVAEQDQQLLPTVMAAWKASSGELPEHAALGEMLKQLLATATENLLADLNVLSVYLQMESNPCRGMTFDESVRAFSVITSALSYSQTIRLGNDPGITKTFSASGPDGVCQPWNVLGMGNWLTFRGLFVFRDDNATADPAMRSSGPA